MIKLSDYVIKFIENLGVKHVFMFSGGGAMHLVDSLGKSEEIEYICTLHEQAAAIAMESYSQFTGNFGVTLVTTGPGGTNAITGLAAAWIDSIPCIVLSGQVKRADLKGSSGVRQMGGQEIDIVSIVDSITKYAVTILEPDSIRYHLEKAVYRAKTGRPGPGWTDSPLDVQAGMMAETVLEGFNRLEEKIDSLQFESQIDESISMLKKAERPVILAGNGIRLANAMEEFKQMVDLLGVPVLTTWKAADFLPENHPLFAGRPGAIGQRGANFTQQNADLIISIGARMDLVQTGYNHANFAPVAKKIFVDIDKSELSKMKTHVDIKLCSDAKRFITEILQRRNELCKDKSSALQEWRDQCLKWKQQYPVVLDKYWDNEDGVDTYVLVDSLSDIMQENDILVPGSSGACAEITLQAFKAKHGQRIINSPGLGSMGFGLPASIGVCLASGKKRVVCIDGDGGIQLNIQELEILFRLNLPIKIFVLNNQGYGSIRNTQQNYFEGYYVGSEASSGLTFPDILKVAKAYGINCSRIVSQENIKAQLLEVLDGSGPMICEVVTPITQLTMPKLSSIQGDDGSMTSKPLEDLWPFLDREEFSANMAISKKVKGV
jgi:acetolactate synthase-1/2/3 large subunit